MRFFSRAKSIIRNVVSLMDTHQGSCMVLLTAALAATACISCYLSAKNIQAMKEIEIERSRPMVVLEVWQEIPFYGVRLRNAGLTAARDVVVRTVPDIELCFEDPGKNPIRFLKEKIDFLPPNASFQAMLGKILEIKKNNKSLIYRGTIQYTDSMGRRYTDAVVLDYTLFNGTWCSGKNPIHDIADELEKMRETIERIESGGKQVRRPTESVPADTFLQAPLGATLPLDAEKESMP